MTRVLIVDDDSDRAESPADVTEMRGHTAQIEPLRYLRDESFDFVPLDVKLPGINGGERFLEIEKIRPSTQVMHPKALPGAIGSADSAGQAG